MSVKQRKSSIYRPNDLPRDQLVLIKARHDGTGSKASDRFLLEQNRAYIRNEENLVEIRRRFFERNKRSKEALLREEDQDRPMYPQVQTSGNNQIQFPVD